MDRAMASVLALWTNANENRIMNLGRVICWMLRRHHWRRLHIAEQLIAIAPIITGDEDPALVPHDPHLLRVCKRCGVQRIVKRRAAKQ